MQLTLHATRPTRRNASRLVQSIFSWWVKTRGAPSRHCRDARVCGHTTTAMHNMRTHPPPRARPPPLPTPPPCDVTGEPQQQQQQQQPQQPERKRQLTKTRKRLTSTGGLKSLPIVTPSVELLSHANRKSKKVSQVSEQLHA